MPIHSEHPQYTEYKKKWQVVDDAIKSKYESYIVPPEYGTDTRSTARNQAYVDRAIFTNYTIGTRNALVGIATQKDPVLELPPGCEYLEWDCTADRLTLKQLIRKSLGAVVEKARFALLTDFPALDTGKTAEEMTALQRTGRAVPRIYCYKAEDLINWDVDNSGGEQRLNFAVLREEVRVRIDGYQWGCDYQYKVLALDEDGYYFITIRDKGDNILFGPHYPLFNGNKLDYIPLDIIGSEDNNVEIDESVLYPIAHVNFGHLRNNANFEDNLDAHGQGTLFLTSDLSLSQWQELTAQRPVVMGSREGYFLGKQGTATLCQLGPNQIASDAMKQKEEQMLAMGAHIITVTSANAPVETTQLNMGSKMSPLVSFVKNVEQGISNQLQNCALCLGANPELVVLDIPKDFIPKVANPTIMQAMLAQHMAGIVSKRIIREYDRGVDLIPDGITDEDIDAELSEEDPLGSAANPGDPFATKDKSMDTDNV